MLPIDEYNEICEAVQSMDSQFTDDVINNAEYYEIEEDPITLQTTATIFDANGAVLTSVTVEDYDVVHAYLENFFDLEEYEPDEADDEAAASASRYGHA